MFLPPFWSCFLCSDFSLHFHLLYKKSLRVVWCPLLLHQKYRTWHISALHSAASVYTVIHTPESAGTGNPTMTCQTLLIAFLVQILIPSSYLHILLGYIQSYEVPCWQICRCGISSHLGKDSVGAAWGGWHHRKKPAIHPHRCMHVGNPLTQHQRAEWCVIATLLHFWAFCRRADAQPERKEPFRLQWLNSFLP